MSGEAMPCDAPGPLRVAVVGAGPSGLYTADALTFDPPVPVLVDVLERLPVPFGLLRYGVAPDHPTIKSAATALQEVIERPVVGLYCNVAVGEDVTVEEVRRRYDAVVYATGADADRTLGIPGEELPGSASATSFVKWYNAHPEADRFDLSKVRTVALVGAGNVAVDVARMLVKDPGELRDTDVPAHVLKALQDSAVTDVHLLVRRGPEHVKFSTKPLHELGDLAGVDTVVDPAQLPEETPEGISPVARRNLGIFRSWAERPAGGGRRRVHFHFDTAPVRILGDTSVRAVVTRTSGEAGASDRELAVELVLRAVGYRSRPIPGVPFDADRSIVPQADHQVIREGRPQIGEYAVGWVKRGPVGILGTNRADAEDTAAAIFAHREALLAARPQTPPGIEPLLRDRGLSFVDLADWNAISAHEARLGEEAGRPRIKIHDWQRLLAARMAVGTP
ncbi:FAD-dependent oxidoreductase [Nocardioides sp.]|uniref:FAD-dependent oxidoreductase n=1 Tax=Nocardioides sp. TaxID=35761 RepID=UPI0039E2EC74